MISYKTTILLIIILVTFLTILSMFVDNKYVYDKDLEGMGRAGYKCPNCNLVFIVLDAVRPDHLGCYGYHRNISPNIDSLAREGILFENTFVTYP